MMIIGMCGRIAAGKETLITFLKENGFSYNETSSLLKEELEKQGKEITRWNMQDLADGWRKEQGVGALMKKFLEKIDKNTDNIIDSLRNVGEAEFLRGELGEDFVLIAVDAPQKLRFDRILKRGKPSDPKTWEEFIKVDERDNFDKENPMGQQTGKLIGVADFVIINDSDLDKSKKEIQEVWEKIKNKKNL